MDVLFVSSFSPIVRDPELAKALYATAFGIEFEGEVDDYRFTEHLGGVKHFGLWPLAQAAQSCFGTDAWPDDVPVPQASLEFEVDDVAVATNELEGRGYQLLHGARTEPWGQVIARLLTPEGLMVGVCWTPWHHEGETPPG
jgi:catechol 2,3-dioxygenase-like lactoylglutathione lyase family enzyme